MTNGNVVDHIDRIQLPKVSSGSVKNMALVGNFNLAGSQTLFQLRSSASVFSSDGFEATFPFFSLNETRDIE